tara:strand:- start:215 stop:1114 length:900 start_codon:yes stop_codon:yes gene_type:complete
MAKGEPKGIETEASGEVVSSEPVIKSLSPDVYVYETTQNVEDFGDVPYEPIKRSKNNLTPPSPFIPKQSNTHYSGHGDAFCIKNPTDPICIGKEVLTYCEKNPLSPRCNDDSEEDDPYNDLGLFQESVRYIFNPDNRVQKVQKKPISTLYESKQDDTQMDVQKVVRTECRCKDGTIAMGYLDTRTGQKDCSPCRKSNFNSPSIYKNYRTKKAEPNFNGKQVPLRKQVGVSSFGDVNMKGCQTGNANQSLEKVNASATLNKVINTDTLDSVGGTKVTEPTNMNGMPISLYDNCNTNVYGI